jgi:hypothetical protein
MIDIFDIIENQKTIHIDIEGEVSSDGLFYDLEYINELANLLLDNQQDVEFKIFNVKEYRDSEPIQIDRFGMYGAGFQYERSVSCIEFRIDVYITNKLNKKIDESMQDFIDFFTKGAISYKQDKSVELFTIDSREEYMSRPVESARINVSPLDYGFNDFEYDWGIGSHPTLDREHDADGDAVYAAEFRPTDISNMFRDL